VASHQNVLSYIYQVKASKRGVDDDLDIYIETERPLGPDSLPSHEAQITEAYLSLAEDVREYLKKGLLKHFKIHLLGSGQIPVNPKTHKISRVVDSRL
jgi:phenylacetate-coenzyme A ligase PaaK-like adenylate-forming protein